MLFELLCVATLALCGTGLGVSPANAQARMNVKMTSAGTLGSGPHLHHQMTMPRLYFPAILTAAAPTPTLGSALPKSAMLAAPSAHRNMSASASAPGTDNSDAQLAVRAGELFDQRIKTRRLELGEVSHGVPAGAGHPDATLAAPQQPASHNHNRLVDDSPSGVKKWVGISGTWRTTSERIERDVRAVVRAIIAAGEGIITGGASGVDYFATDEALKLAPDGTRVRVALPSTLEYYIDHLRAWAGGHDTGDPSIAQGEMRRLVRQLSLLKNVRPASIIEGPPIPALDIRQAAYDARDTVVAQLASQLVAFQVNKSKGTQDTIDKARDAGKKVSVFSYKIETDKVYGKLKPR